MSDEKEYPIEPPDPDNQLPAPEEPAGQLESPPDEGASVYEMPASEPTPDPFTETIPPAEEPRMSEDYIVTPPPTQVPVKKSNRTIWIIVIVVLLLLCCCCLAVIALSVTGLLPFMDQMDFRYLVPHLTQFA